MEIKLILGEMLSNKYKSVIKASVHCELHSYSKKKFYPCVTMNRKKNLK